MAKQLINTGSIANDGTGDTLRVAFNKVNNNTNELYTLSENGSSLEINTDNDFTSTPNILNFSSQFTASDLLSDGSITSLKIENGLLSTLEYDPQDGNLITAYGSAQEALDLCLRQSSIKNWNVAEQEFLTKEMASILWVKNETGVTIKLVAPPDAFVGLNYRIINNINSLSNFEFRDADDIDTLGIITPGNWIEFQYTNESSWLIIDQRNSSVILTPNSVDTSAIIDSNVSNIKLANMNQSQLKGRSSESSGPPQDLNVDPHFNITSGTFNLTPGSIVDSDVANNSIGGPKLLSASVQNDRLGNMAPATLKGRNSLSLGVPQDITLGTNLTMTSEGVLNASSNSLVLWANINSTPFNALVNNYYLVNTDVGALTISLPTAVGNNGSEITFKKINVNTNNAVIIPQSGQTIDGAPSKSLIFQWDVLTVRSNGSNWLVLKEFPARISFKPVHNFTRTGSTQSFNAGTLTTVVFNNNVGSSGIPNVSLNTSDGTFTFSKVGNYSMSGVLDMVSATANARGLLQLVSAGAGINGYLFSSIQLCSTANTSSPIHFNINFNISIVGDLLLRLTMGAAATLNNISGTGGNTIISRLNITELA